MNVPASTLLLHAWIRDGRWRTASEVADLYTVPVSPPVVGRILARESEPRIPPDFALLEEREGIRQVEDRDYGSLASARNRRVREYRPSVEWMRRLLAAGKL